MIPQRVNDELLSWLTATRLTPVFVIHCNHPAEIDKQVAASLQRITAAGIPLLNQAVLLRGVNDNEETMVALMKKLVQLRRTAKANNQFFVEPEAKLIFCMRISGVNKMSPKPRKILQLLRLKQAPVTTAYGGSLERLERENRTAAARDRKLRAFHQSASLKRALATSVRCGSAR